MAATVVTLSSAPVIPPAAAVRRREVLVLIGHFGRPLKQCLELRNRVSQQGWMASALNRETERPVQPR
jgi:hypothetical protein